MSCHKSADANMTYTLKAKEKMTNVIFSNYSNSCQL